MSKSPQATYNYRPNPRKLGGASPDDFGAAHFTAGAFSPRFSKPLRFANTLVRMTPVNAYRLPLLIAWALTQSDPLTRRLLGHIHPEAQDHAQAITTSTTHRRLPQIGGPKPDLTPPYDTVALLATLQAALPDAAAHAWPDRPDIAELIRTTQARQYIETHTPAQQRYITLTDPITGETVGRIHTRAHGAQQAAQAAQAVLDNA